MPVVKQPNGLWSVVIDGSTVAADLSNSKAWRELDRLNNETVSRQEDVTEWKFKEGLK